MHLQKIGNAQELLGPKEIMKKFSPPRKQDVIPVLIVLENVNYEVVE